MRLPDLGEAMDNIGFVLALVLMAPIVAFVAAVASVAWLVNFPFFLAKKLFVRRIT